MKNTVKFEAKTIKFQANAFKFPTKAAKKVNSKTSGISVYSVQLLTREERLREFVIVSKVPLFTHFSVLIFAIFDVVWPEKKATI